MGNGLETIERVPFRADELEVLNHAIAISEELITDWYKISTSQWRHYRYDIQTLRDLREDEITDGAFAQIHRYARSPEDKLRGGELADYFKICLQDHVIRRAIKRDPTIGLLPLLLYIVTHELIHVVRFAKFLQRFHATAAEQEAEENRVHCFTYQVLEQLKIQGLSQVLWAFRNCRTMETFSEASGARRRSRN